MKTGFKVLIGLAGATVIIGGSYLAYNCYNTPKFISSDGSKITLKFKCKPVVIDVKDMSEKGLFMQMGGWTLKPSYGNESDKKTLNGLYLTDSKGVVYKTFYLAK